LLAATGPALAQAQQSEPNPPGTAALAPPWEVTCDLPAAQSAPNPRLPFDDPPAQREFRAVWGIAGTGGDYGQRTAPNGVVYRPDYHIDFDFNIWLWPAQGLYLYDESRFFMGSTHEGLNFTKRELDMDIGIAWNYCGRLEARMFGYADNNINRGNSLVDPSGYSDGFGVENRYYLSDVYSALGTSDYDQAKATFVSIGYYPTKVMIGADGLQFHPSLFARAYLTWDVIEHCCYLYADTLFIAERPVNAKLLDTDVGVAVRPLSEVPRLEFRVGCQDVWDMQVDNARPVGYVSIRYIF